MIDDLESCLWVLVFELLEHAKESGTLKTWEETILTTMNGDDINIIAVTRPSLFLNYGDVTHSPIISLLFSLLTRWWEIAGKAARGIPEQPQEGQATAENIEEYRNICKTHLKEVLFQYLDAGNDFLKREGTDLGWDTIV